MPTIAANTGLRVLLTGANGFIGIWVFRILLEQGYTVRAAVRSLEKSKRLKERFASYSDKVEWVIVKDMTKDGAFDDALKDVDAIVHMASPVNGTPGPIPMVRDPLLTKVKRVVLTSSCAAITATVEKPTRIFTEDDWGDEFVEACQAQGKDANERFKYRASKVLAERGKIGWDLVVLNPPLEVSDDFLKHTYSTIDVRDIATAHVASLSNEKAGGERLIISNGAIKVQETRNLIASLKPNLYTNHIFPRGKPELNSTILLDYNGEKGKRILGIKYRSREETFTDTLADFEARGWLEKPVY
ncbi:hypothetical protein CPB84DRAFT_1780753 [Gymnopilus junonius]|uniref:NAD-dependent epimerase/dehydratase domain-containing protein n=1 Tax=Gymnopilus junonius TaxID=109634 RepID=A0A9P5TLI0_GYMJU|nr:hypothetical protein CPB84DRAFT_1780753 [Gymnopilus junonius]